jgi:thiamine monophosphate kinase
VIRDVIYIGSDTQYLVQLGPSIIVMVRVPNDTPPEGRHQAGPGDTAWVKWQVGSTAVLLG